MNETQAIKSPKLQVLLGIVVVVGVLYVAREIFVPIAIAILLSFLLAPLVRRLSKWKFPNVAAVATTVLTAFIVISIVGWLVSQQIVNLADNLPRYQDNLRSKAEAVLASDDDSAFSRAAETLDSLREEIEEEVEEEQEAQATEVDPLPVEIQQSPPGPFQTLRQFAGPLLGPLGTAGITLVFVIFILLQRNDLRDRFIKLVSGGNLNLATQAVDDATRRITRYLVMHSIINVAYGFPVAVGLYFIGVPNALLWGILATLLRFIPFVGAWISAIFPISLAFAVDPGWTMPLLTVALIVVLELFSNNVLEPWLYGSSTGISIVALLFAALVWTWIWGPVGLFLSTPLTVCLLVIGKNVPSLNFLNVILGTDPVLDPAARLYQRMLAMDSESLFELAENDLADSTLTSFYDQVLVPALTLAEVDRHEGLLAEHRQEFIIQSMQDLLDDLGTDYVEHLPPSSGKSQVLCVPARDQADELSSMMFMQVLQKGGIYSESIKCGYRFADLADRAKAVQAEIICICAIPPGALVASRKLCRQLRDIPSEVKLVVGIWGAKDGATALENRLGAQGPDFVADSMADAVAQIRSLLDMKENPAKADSIGPVESEELGALGLLDTPPEEMISAVIRKLADVYEVPLSLVSIIDTDHQFWKSQVNFTKELAEADHAPLTRSLCSEVVVENELFVIEDLSQDKRFSGNHFVKERGIRFYAGAPLRTSRGHTVGTLSVIDIKPRTITQEQKRILNMLADQLMQRMENRL